MSKNQGPFLQIKPEYPVCKHINNFKTIGQGEVFKVFNKSAWILMMKNRNDKSIFSNARKIFEMALEQGRSVKEVARVSS